MRLEQKEILHDFQDGNGPISAHQHELGGGWVASTAHVEETVYIGPDARIFGYATIKDKAIVTENAEVSGYATIQDLACIKGNAVIRGACMIKDYAEIAGNVFIASRITIKGYAVLNKNQCSFDVKDCLKCPALLDENYGSTHKNQCLYCLEKLSERKKAASDSRRTTVRSWTPEDGGINENVKTETNAPQRRGRDNP